VIYDGLYSLNDAVEDGPPNYITIIDGVFNSWFYFVALVLLFAMGAKRQRGLWSTYAAQQTVPPAGMGTIPPAGYAYGQAPQPMPVYGGGYTGVPYGQPQPMQQQPTGGWQPQQQMPIYQYGVPPQQAPYSEAKTVPMATSPPPQQMTPGPEAHVQANGRAPHDAKTQP
jgi:hypothetical protein